VDNGENYMAKSFLSVLTTVVSELEWARGYHKMHTKFWLESFTARDHLGDIGIYRL